MKETPKQTPKVEPQKEAAPKTDEPAKQATQAQSPKSNASQPAPKPAAKPNTPKKPPTEDTMSSPKDKPSPTSSTKEKKSGSGLALFVAILALLIALVVGGGAGWMYQQNMELRQELASQDSELASKLNLSSRSAGQREKQIDSVIKQLKSQKQTNNQIQNSVAMVSEQVSEFDKSLQAISKTDRSDWALAEAEFLLRLANERVFTGGNLANAKGLLKSAEAILVSVDEMGLLPIRQALANDMIILNEAAETDRVGLYMKLEALSGLVAKLSVIDTEAPDEGDKIDVMDAIDGDAPIEKQFEQGFDAALDKLNSYIRIENRSEPVQAVPTPAESVLVQHNLRILINQAQLAVMSSDQALYNKSLEKVESEAARYLSMKDINTRIFLDSVKEYKDIELVGQLPDISRSRQMLKTYLDKRHFLPESAKNAVTGDVSAAKPAAQPKQAKPEVVKPIEAKKGVQANASSLKLTPADGAASAQAAQGE